MTDYAYVAIINKRVKFGYKIDPFLASLKSSTDEECRLNNYKLIKYYKVLKGPGVNAIDQFIEKLNSGEKSLDNIIELEDTHKVKDVSLLDA